VHPALNRLTPYKQSSNDLVEGPILGGPMNLADDCQTMSSDGQFVGRYLPNLNAHQRRIVFYYTVFPSLFISLHPDFVMLHYLRRANFDQTLVTCQFLFHPDSTRQMAFDPQRAIEFWDQTNRQDWHVCELTQRGMSDPGYRPGPYSNLESMLAAFDRHYFECARRYMALIKLT
jgi:Rieske 2Fe-2S family protein